MGVCPACWSVEIAVVTAGTSLFASFLPNISFRNDLLPTAITTASTAVCLVKYGPFNPNKQSGKVALAGVSFSVAILEQRWLSDTFILTPLYIAAGSFVGYNIVKEPYRLFAMGVGGLVGAFTYTFQPDAPQPIPININTDGPYEGSAMADLYTASKKGGCFFGKGGLDVMIANEGLDRFFFSLCSTRIINGLTANIENFNQNINPEIRDEIHVFCTKLQVKQTDLSLEFVEKTDTTLPYTKLMIDNNNVKEEPVVAISVTGYHPDLLQYVHLNLKWTESKEICASSQHYEDYRQLEVTGAEANPIGE